MNTNPDNSPGFTLPRDPLCVIYCIFTSCPSLSLCPCMPDPNINVTSLLYPVLTTNSFESSVISYKEAACVNSTPSTVTFI